MFNRDTSSVPRGPKGSHHLNIEDIRRVERLALLAQEQDFALNWMLTVRVPAEFCNAQGKRYVHNVTRALFQALRRRGSPSVAVTIYECPRKTQHLHAHVLIHIPRPHTDLIERRRDPPLLHVRRTDDNAVAYVTKERWTRPSGRGFYEQGAYIPGPRISFTKDATALVSQGILFIPPQAPAAHSSLSNVTRLSPATFGTKLRTTRTGHKLTQKDFYGLIGVSRAHGANVEAGRCRLSPGATQTALQVMQKLKKGTGPTQRGRSLAA